MISLTSIAVGGGSSMPRERAIFISHSYRYDGPTANDLITRLLRRKHFRIRDLSVLVTRRFPEQSAEELKDQIRDLIKQADALILIWRRADSDMVRFELDVAKENGIPIIAVPPPKGIRIPAIARQYADRVVKRNVNSIVKAIVELSGRKKGVKSSPILHPTEPPSLMPEVVPEFQSADAPIVVPPTVDTAPMNLQARKQGFFARLFGL
jgi:hypothetical protein